MTTGYDHTWSVRSDIQKQVNKESLRTWARKKGEPLPAYEPQPHQRWPLVARYGFAGAIIKATLRFIP